MGRIRLLLVLVLSAALVFGATAFWRFWFLLPYPVAVDCQGKEIDVETVRQWEEREAGRTGALGICGIAGWTIGTEQQIVSVSTGRKGMARIMKVYGSMELAGYLKEQKYETVELAGVVTHICVLSNAVLAKSALPDSEIVVDASCCASNDPSLGEKALDLLEGLQIKVIGRG